MRKKLILIALTTILFWGSITPTYITYAAESSKTEDITIEESYDEETLIVKKNHFVADTLDGVDAIYRPGKNDGRSATYSCAAFIKKYYKEEYDVSVYNLYGGSTPLTYEGTSFQSIKTPKVGDIAATSSHWAIVKQVDKENKEVVLIEQNWKWQQSGQTVCKINRTISFDDLKFYRLNID